MKGEITMYYTNKANLPEPLVKALMFDDYEHRGDISVTGLITPPRIYQLRERHDHEITIDVLDNFWSMLGKAIHLILEQYAEKSNVLGEERMYIDIAGWKIAGKPDIWEPPATLGDYKFTSVWSVIYGIKPEWEAQMNCYNQFYQAATFPVNEMKIYVLGRDWSKAKAMQGYGYPEHEISVMNVPIWDSGAAWRYMENRVKLHQHCEGLEDDRLPHCTPEERWEKKTTYAVMKEGRKRALRVFDSLVTAASFKGSYKDSNKTYIEERPGKSTRCEEYCPVEKFCSQHKEMKEVENGK